ncbi:type II secretion system protein GspM [Comamonas flocculans]|uniref:General secretion pathway protein GspM n=1 Tax=Comamonas flocculans TaxID=2597701 RepID=A0A5B8RUL4_9BURK|nr:type II secretion system protein GspM [Comamonas flocculans]QEA13236.1 general secretion pathway protein GspM [Comamonas flocculans]
MSRGQARDRWVLALTMVVLALPLVAGTAYVVEKHRWAQSQLEQLAPRYARLQGMVQASAAIEAANQQASASLRAYLYPADKTLNQAGNEMQQQIRDALSAAGLRVGSSQVMQSKSELPGLERVQVGIKAEGDLPALQAALLGLQALHPAVWVDSLAVNVMGAARAEAPQNLSIQMELSAWKESS